MKPISNIGDLRRALERYPDDQPVQVLRQSLIQEVGGNGVLMPPIVIYDQLVIQAVFDSPGWHPGSKIVRLGVHHQNGVFNHSCVSPSPTDGTEPKSEPPATSGSDSTVDATPDERKRIAAGELAVEGNQQLCPSCGWANHKIRQKCRNCKQPMPEAS